MTKIIVTGINTDVGKTVASSILATVLGGDYWKPIQCGDGDGCDSEIVKNLLDLDKHRVLKPAYNLKAPFSPHHAARLENVEIDPKSIVLPETSRPLIIETVGGILVPLTSETTTLDVFKTWNCPWIIVSKNYIGSINHTLLTVDTLKRNDVDIAGIIFNGEPNADSEEAIFNITKLPILGRILPEETINLQTIQKYAGQWKSLAIRPKH